MKKSMAWAVLATALTAEGALAQEPAAEVRFDLTGTVIAQSGALAVGAFVSLEGEDWGTLTNAAGRFVLPGVRAGEVTLTVELIGYETLTWTGTVEDGAQLTLALASKPIVLEGLTVLADRFESRRRATATSVRWFDRTTLASSPYPTALDFLAGRGGLARVTCRGTWSSECVLARGRVVEPSVWVDEARHIGGLDYLRTLQPHELYMVEVYAGGRHIRAYTHRYMEWAAAGRALPMALLF